MLILITGNGKGKTTSALGQGMRIVGSGGKVVMHQFIKGPWKAGEEEAVKKFSSKFKIRKGGRGFVGIMNDNLPRQVHIEAAKKTWLRAKEDIISKKYDLVVLDELNIALNLRLLSLKEIVPTLKKYKNNREIMVTGRYAPKTLIKLADLVSEVKEIKHPYQKGVQGKKKIEF